MEFTTLNRPKSGANDTLAPVNGDTREMDAALLERPNPPDSQPAKHDDPISVRLVVNITKGAHSDLKRTAKLAGMDLGTFVSVAVQVLKLILAEVRSGGTICVVKNERVVREFLLPFG